MPLQPTVDDLSPWTLRGLEEEFSHRERDKCSREDFAAGFIGALVFLRSASSFKQRGSESAHAAETSQLFADLRGKRVPVQVAGLPFVTAHYRRPIQTP